MLERVYCNWSPEAERISWDPKYITPISRHELPSLKVICASSLAKNSRLFDTEILQSIGDKNIKIIWQELVATGRDSLETWILFIKHSGPSFKQIQPVYTCSIDLSRVLYARSTILNITSGMPDFCNCVILNGPIALNNNLLIALAGFSNLSYLDLRKGYWPQDVEEVRYFINSLVKNMHQGGFQTLECLRLPRRGPLLLKKLLKLTWPKCLSYLQCPIHPEGYKWECLKSEIMDKVGQKSYSLQILLTPTAKQSSLQIESEYLKGCYKRKECKSV